jgi:hypothetical protein
MTEGVPKLSEIIAKIKSRGYWEVIIRPLKFEKELLKNLKDCANLVLENKVRLRGWDYPHVSNKYGIQSGDNWVENVTDWSSYEEFWRMYQSGQFFHLFGCREDWWGPVQIFWSEKHTLEPGYGLSFLSTLYTFTEIYEFVSRLSKKGLFDDFLNVSITLHGMKKRRIVTLEINRTLNDNYICNIEDIQLNRKIATSEIIGKSSEFAVDDTYRVFERFNWLDPPRQVLNEEQSKFLKGNI